MTSQSIRSLNATTAGGDLTYETPEQDFARLDRFPFAVRWRIATANTKLAAAGFEQHYRWARGNGGEGLTIARIDQIERNEIAVFAGQYRGETGLELPFVKAEIGMQPYGPLGESRHPPRRYGKPVFRAQNRKRPISRKALRAARSG